MQPVARCVLCSVRHTRHNLVGQRKIVVHKYKQVLRCDVLIVIADNNDAYSHSNLYYVWKKTIFVLDSFRGEMGHTVGEVGHNHAGRYEIYRSNLVQY